MLYEVITVAHRDFYDLSTDAVYNSLEETADELSLQGIFPLKNGKFKLIRNNFV